MKGIKFNKLEQYLVLPGTIQLDLKGRSEKDVSDALYACLVSDENSKVMRSDPCFVCYGGYASQQYSKAFLASFYPTRIRLQFEDDNIFVKYKLCLWDNIIMLLVLFSIGFVCYLSSDVGFIVSVCIATIIIIIYAIMICFNVIRVRKRIRRYLE